MKQSEKSDIIKELAHLINCRSLENDSNTPDFVLAEYMLQSLIILNRAINNRGDYSEKAPEWNSSKWSPYRHRDYLVNDGAKVCSVAKWNGKEFELKDGCGIGVVKRWMELPDMSVLQLLNVPTEKKP
jgi:hypothetical protein